MKKILLIILSVYLSANLSAQITAKEMGVLAIPTYFDTYMTESSIKKVYNEDVSLNELIKDNSSPLPWIVYSDRSKNAFLTDFGSNGINDAFRAEFSDLSLVKSYNLRIYNRWGVLIWETTDPEEYWLGEVGANGEYYSQNDVYVWQIEVRSDLWGDIAKKLLGHVTIIR